MKFDDFRVTTKIRKINLWVQIILGFTLYVGLNFLSARHYYSHDFSESHKNSLSPESKAYIKNLPSSVDIYVVVSTRNLEKENMSVLKDLELFLSRYEAASKTPNKIRVNFVNSNVESKTADELAKKFGRNIENSVIVSGKTRSKIIPIDGFYEMSEGSKKFKGETIITSALLYASNQKQLKIYFTAKHGELKYTDTNATNGLSEFTSALQTSNYKLEELDLTLGKPIPEDADMLIIAAPQISYLPSAIYQIRQYLLERNGKVVVFLRMGSDGGLKDVFYEWGILADDMQIYDVGDDYESASGDLIVRTIPEKSHTIVESLKKASMPVLFGSVRPVREDMGADVNKSLSLSPLILSSYSSWAEKSYARSGIHKYDESVDLRGPIPLAMIASRTGGEKFNLNIPGGKLAVFGDENFITNKSFYRLGNSMLVLNTINWMFEENKMLPIPPRDIKMYSLTISHNEFIELALRFLILPFIILAVGITVSFVRRN